MFSFSNVTSQGCSDFIHTYNKKISGYKCKKIYGKMVRDRRDKYEIIPFTIWMKDKNMLRIDTDSKTVFRFDDTIWIYMKSTNTVYLDDYKKTQYDSIYSVLTIPEGENITYDVGELSENDKSITKVRVRDCDIWQSGYLQIDYDIDSSNYTPVRTTFFHSTGEITDYYIKEFITSESIPTGSFFFLEDNYPDVKIVDLTK